MAQLQLPIHKPPVRLRLQESYPRVQLRDDVVVLVVRGHDAKEGGAVRADLRHVVVCAAAVFGAPVAACARLLPGEIME